MVYRRLTPYQKMPMFAASHLVFVDSTLPDLPTLLSDLPPDVQVHLLPPNRNGMEFMAQTLIGRSGIETLHLLCHGAPGALQVGSVTLERASLTRYAAILDIVRDTMVPDGQWLLCGCDVAAGAEGRRFIEALRLMTGLHVAAASHKVGAATPISSALNGVKFIGAAAEFGGHCERSAAIHDPGRHCERSAAIHEPGCHCERSAAIHAV